MSEPTPLEAIFFAALDKPAAERGSYLAEACGSDADLRRRVERMLTAQMDAASFLETPPSAIGEGSPTMDQATLEKPGTQIGPYKLLQQIGEGGMGVVYMAEQHEPVKADLVKLRFFAGLTMCQAADALGVSLATAERYWTFAKAWLHSELAEDSPSES